MEPILGVYGVVSRFSSFSLFFALVVFVAHNLIEIGNRKWRADYCFWPSVSSLDLCFVFSEKISAVAPCQVLRNGKRLSYRTIQALQQTRGSILSGDVLGSVFRKACRRFLEDFVSSLISRVTTISLVGQRLRCFSPRSVIGGDNYFVFHFFG